MPASIPHGTELGPRLFLVMVNHLGVADKQEPLKYVDVSIMVEIINKD